MYQIITEVMYQWTTMHKRSSALCKAIFIADATAEEGNENLEFESAWVELL